MKKVLIAIDEFANSSNEPISLLKQNGFEVIFNTSKKPLDFKKSSDLYSDVSYVIAGLESYPEEFFKSYHNILAISRVGVGTDSINLSAAKQHNTKIFITSDKPSVSVAELCISNMISILRKTFVMNDDLKKGIWRPIQGRDLRDATIGIVGLGSIGKQVASRVKCFGSKIIAYSRTWDDEFAIKNKIKRKTIQEVFCESDIITIHLPLTNETTNIISSELIKSCRHSAIILNTSRAGVVDNTALAMALKNKMIYGAALDVFDEERDTYPYTNLDNVILTPHIGSHTYETRRAMELMAAQNIIEYESLNYLSDPDKIREVLAYIEKHSVL